MDERFVTDDEIDKALSFLRDSAAAIGQARRRSIYTEKMTKHIKALVMKMHLSLPVSGQEREAYASDEYLNAIAEEADAAAEFEKLRSLREAAALKIEVWRSINANYRSMKV